MHVVQVMGWTAGAILLGAVTYPLLQKARKSGWCHFLGTSPHDFSDSLKGKFVPYSGAPSRANSGEIAHLTATAENGLSNGGIVASGSPDRPASGVPS